MKMSILSKLVSILIVLSLAAVFLPLHTVRAEGITPVTYKDNEIKRNFSGEDSAAYPMKPDDVVGSHFSIAADATYVGLACPSWSDSEGSLTVALFNFNTDYETSVSAEPIAKNEFVDYNDNAFLGFDFGDNPLKAGEYVIEITDAVPDDDDGGGVGVWTQLEYPGQRFYENGEYNPSLSLRMAVIFVNEPETPYGTLTVKQESSEGGEINYTPYLDCILKFSDDDAETYFTDVNALFIDSLEITDEGYLAVEVTPGNDPQFYIDIPGWVDGPSRDDYPVMLIRMKQTAGTIANGEMYFSTTEFPGPAPGGAVTVNYEKTNDWQNVIINLKSNKNFTGMLQRLRFDIVGSASENCSYLIDYILFFESVEAAQAFKHEDLEAIIASKPTPEPATPTPEPTPTPSDKPATASSTSASNAPLTASPKATSDQADGSDGINTTEIVVICICAALIIAGVVLIIITVKKKKASK